jgi:hypothetical protein
MTYETFELTHCYPQQLLEHGMLTLNFIQAIIRLAQGEAIEWKLKHVELWNPTEVVQEIIDKTGLVHSQVEREKDSIPSLMWYGKGSGKMDEIDWIGNEKFVWC